MSEEEIPFQDQIAVSKFSNRLNEPGLVLRAWGT